MNQLLIMAGFIVLVVLLVMMAPFIKNLLQGEQGDEKLPFRFKKYFFTKSEQEFFRILEQQIDHSRFTIFPKVRLGDFVETTAKGEKRQASWNRIKSRHVDFLIYDTQKSLIAVAIELDGNSHNSERAQKSDDFKNRLYSSIGLELVRVKVGTDFATEISQILEKL